MSLLGISFCVLAVFAVSISGTCPDGWQTFKGNCYFLNTAKKLWIDARKDCISLGGHLARVESAEENMFLKKTYLGSKGSYVWIDGTDIHKEGKWIWSSTSEPIAYKNWSHGQPDNNRSKQHYMALWPSGQWDDGYVDYAAISLCEIDAAERKVQQSCQFSNFLLKELVKCRKQQ